MAKLSGTTIGFIGLGLMGKPMARNLAAAGARMIVHNRSTAAMTELAREGMTPGNTSREVAEQSDIVITMLTDTPAVEAVTEGADGIAAGTGEGLLVIDMGTTLMPVTRRMADVIQARGGDYLDAPVSGGTIGADSGSLIIMAGGSDAAMARAMPLFEVLGSRTTHVGDVGAGQVAKAANQVIVGLNIGAVAEALTLARHAGIDPARVRDALQGGFADSRILEVHGRRMVENDFTPGGKCTTQRKDMDQAITLAGAFGLSLPATELCRDLYDKVIDAGFGDIDHAGLIKAIDPA